MPRVNRTQKVFSIDSSQKRNTNETGSKFSVELKFPQRNAFNKASCLECECPKSFYLIDSENNTITLNEATGGGDTTATLTAGYYNMTEFIAEVKSELDTASFNTETYTVSYVALTGKINIVNGTNDFTLTLNESMQKFLGMEASVTSVGNTLLATKMANLQRYGVLYLRCNSVDNANDNILAELYPSSVPDQSIIKYVPADTYTNSVSLNENTSEIFEFSLEDKNGKVVQMNGGNIRLILSCWNESI